VAVEWRCISITTVANIAFVVTCHLISEDIYYYDLPGIDCHLQVVVKWKDGMARNPYLIRSEKYCNLFLIGYHRYLTHRMSHEWTKA
jgi:hypothetical protein